MDFAAYLKSLRKARGHTSARALSQYAKTRTHNISAQAIRNFESGERIPNQESRRVMKDILHMSAEAANRFDGMVLHATINRGWPDTDFVLITSLNRKAIMNQICDIVGDLDPQQKAELQWILSNPSTLIKST